MPSAQPDPSEQYQDIGEVRQAVSETGGELLQKLASLEIIDEPSVNQLSMGEVSSHSEYVSEGEGTILGIRPHNDEWVPFILVGKQINSEKLVMTIVPEMDRAYAVLKNENSDMLIKRDDKDADLTSTSTSDGYTTTTACMVQEQCRCIDGYKKYECYCCEDGSCYWGEHVGPCIEGNDCVTYCCTVCNTC